MATTYIFFSLLGCLLLGIAYAFALYRWQTRLNKTLLIFLFGLRTITVATIAFLLFAPPFKTISKTTEKPIIILAQDNSASIALSEPASFKTETYIRQLRLLEKTLSKDYEVKSLSFGMNVKQGLNFKFDERLSNLSLVFKMIDNEFANRNIGADILASDGIYNQGGNPIYESKNLKAPVYTVALGDSVPKKDILISNVNYNNIAYLDNQFQIEVGVEAYQSGGAVSKLSVSDQSGILFSRPVNISSEEYRVTVPLTLSARRKGIQRYSINLSAVSNELSVLNNSQTIFVEVIDGRQNVLIIANSPHPDVSAFRQSIEINKNYKVLVAFADKVTDNQIEKAGLVILHQLPSVNNAAQKILKQVEGKPTLFVLGAQSNTNIFSSSQNLLNLSSSGSTQEALARIQPDFYGFTISENTKIKLRNFSPLISPYGNYGLKNPGTIAFVQQIGKVVTNTPLLVFGEDQKRRVGVLAGEGIWRWRLEDFLESNNHEAVNELLSKTVQYLSSRDDKRKFRVYPAKNSFDEDEHIILNAELYNDAFELLNTPDVGVSVKNKEGKSYSFLFSRSGNAYLLDAGILPAGEYDFSAKTKLGSKNYNAAGKFIIRQEQAEFQQTTANHQMLFALAVQHGGQMIYPGQLSRLAEMIKADENVKTVVYEDRKYVDLINYKIIFFLLLALLSTEWFSRKRNGEV
ncbi:MAG: hypothetical protein H7096_05700 [Flavobacterium sp.]|nr:hypothetical protein [Pedobacter sp.]